MNLAYNKLVKPGGIVHDDKNKDEEFLHVKELYSKVLQTYIREARRSIHIKVFKAKIWR